MVAFDYFKSPAGLDDAAGRRAALLTPEEIHYDLFLGDVVLRAAGEELKTDSQLVPILDFAVCIADIVRNLQDGDTEAFEFTESDARIVFSRTGPQVRIEANFSPFEAVVPYADLSKAALEFATRVLSDVKVEYAAIGENPHFRVLVDRMRNA